MKLSEPTEETCSDCKGNGKCPYCSGGGIEMYGHHFNIDCRFCIGKGKCSLCEGKGRRLVRHVLPEKDTQNP